MNESELRRQELLRQTRKLYNDHNELPAVHPRYGFTMTITNSPPSIPGTAGSAAACTAMGVPPQNTAHHPAGASMSGW